MSAGFKGEKNMLQVSDGAIREMPQNESVSMTTLGNVAQTYTPAHTSVVGSVQFETTGYYWQPYTYWGNYPVYVCTDKTKKAIEVLKALQSEKLLKCASVPRFIALVEKISGLL